MKIKKIQIEGNQKKNDSKMMLNNWVSHSINAQNEEQNTIEPTPKRYLEINRSLTFKMLKSTERKNK